MSDPPPAKKARYGLRPRVGKVELADEADQPTAQTPAAPKRSKTVESAKAVNLQINNQSANKQPAKETRPLARKNIFPFLALPRELRDKIYGYYLDVSPQEAYERAPALVESGSDDALKVEWHKSRQRRVSKYEYTGGPSLAGFWCPFTMSKLHHGYYASSEWPRRIVKSPVPGMWSSLNSQVRREAMECHLQRVCVALEGRGCEEVFAEWMEKLPHLMPLCKKIYLIAPWMLNVPSLDDSSWKSFDEGLESKGAAHGNTFMLEIRRLPPQVNNDKSPKLEVSTKSYLTLAQSQFFSVPLEDVKIQATWSPSNSAFESRDLPTWAAKIAFYSRPWKDMLSSFGSGDKRTKSRGFGRFVDRGVEADEKGRKVYRLIRERNELPGIRASMKKRVREED